MDPRITMWQASVLQEKNFKLKKVGGFAWPIPKYDKKFPKRKMLAGELCEIYIDGEGWEKVAILEPSYTPVIGCYEISENVIIRSVKESFLSSDKTELVKGGTDDAWRAANQRVKLNEKALSIRHEDETKADGSVIDIAKGTGDVMLRRALVVEDDEGEEAVTYLDNVFGIAPIRTCTEKEKNEEGPKGI